MWRLCQHGTALTWGLLQALPLAKSSSRMLTDIRALHLQCKRAQVSGRERFEQSAPAALSPCVQGWTSMRPGNAASARWSCEDLGCAGCGAGRACSGQDPACYQQPCVPSITVELKPLVGSLRTSGL